MPQTKQQLRQLMQERGLTPRRRWGQNFLIDLNLMHLLVDRAELAGDEVVLEVGCGTGSMTELLADQAGAVVAVDIDEGLLGIARDRLEERGNVTLVHCDILSSKHRIDAEVLTKVAAQRDRLGGRFLLIANLPYQAATPLLLNLATGQNPPDGMYVTVQAEVAQRMTAQPGVKAYGMISILLQTTGQLELVRTIKPQAFWPMPRVHSAMVIWRYEPERRRAITNMEKFRCTVELLLGHRRKKISTCLAGLAQRGNLPEVLGTIGIDADNRGERLTPEQFVQLSNRL